MAKVSGADPHDARPTAFSSASFLPSIPEIVKDLNTSATVLNISIAVFILVIGITPLIWAPYSGICKWSVARVVSRVLIV